LSFLSCLLIQLTYTCLAFTAYCTYVCNWSHGAAWRVVDGGSEGLSFASAPVGLFSSTDAIALLCTFKAGARRVLYLWLGVDVSAFAMPKTMLCTPSVCSDSWHGLMVVGVSW
jgi:hypothetical protein